MLVTRYTEENCPNDNVKVEFSNGCVIIEKEGIAYGEDEELFLYPKEARHVYEELRKYYNES